MASENIFIVTVHTSPSVIITDDDPELLGQVILDWMAENPTISEFAINLRQATRRTAGT